LLDTAPRLYVAALFEQTIKDSVALGIFLVSKYEWLFDTGVIQNV